MKTTGIVICNYNKKEYVLRCIQSVLESDTQDYSIYVVDNASTDGSADAILARYGVQVTVLKNPENLGGSGGFNRGIRHALSQNHTYIWCLDNDTLVDEHALSSMIQCLKNHPDVGLVGSRIYQMDQPGVLQENGIRIDYKNYCMDSPYLNRVDDGTLPDFLYADAVAACSLLIRTSVVREIGCMPEENFLYWDDTEWCCRCRDHGYQVAVCGTSYVLHAMGAKKEVVNTFATYYAWRNWITFFLHRLKEQELDSFSLTMLGSVFNVLYEGWFRGEPNRGKTVMFALDDALHQKTGKAKDSYFFDIEHTYSDLEELCRQHEKFVIVSNHLPALASRLQLKITEENPAAKISIVSDLKELSDTGDAFPLVVCDSIFLLTDFSLTYTYVDDSFNVYAKEEDTEYIRNYWYSRYLFIATHQPLFLEKAQKIRSGS